MRNYYGYVKTSDNASLHVSKKLPTQRWFFKEYPHIAYQSLVWSYQLATANLLHSSVVYDILVNNIFSGYFVAHLERLFLIQLVLHQ